MSLFSKRNVGEDRGEAIEIILILLPLFGSEIADGRSETSPESEQMKPACAKHKRRNSVSVKQFQDRGSW